MIDLVGKIFKVFDDNNLFEEGVELIGTWKVSKASSSSNAEAMLGI